MHLYGTATSYIFLPPPPKIPVGCGPAHAYQRGICDSLEMKLT